MPRTGAMYAGASGGNYNVNKMAPGLGNGKWQGIAPTGQKRASVVRHIQANAWGNNYTGVFCFNALGGVGRISNMFAPNADGARKDCQGYVAPPTPPTPPPPLHLDQVQTLEWLEGVFRDPANNAYWSPFPANAQPAILFVEATATFPLLSGGVNFEGTMISNVMLSEDGYYNANVVYVPLADISVHAFNVDPSPTVVKPNGGVVYNVYCAINTSTNTFIDSNTANQLQPQVPLGSYIIGVANFMI